MAVDAAEDQAKEKWPTDTKKEVDREKAAQPEDVKDVAKRKKDAPENVPEDTKF